MSILATVTIFWTAWDDVAAWRRVPSILATVTIFWTAWDDVAAWRRVESLCPNLWVHESLCHDSAKRRANLCEVNQSLQPIHGCPHLFHFALDLVHPVFDDLDRSSSHLSLRSGFIDGLLRHHVRIFFPHLLEPFVGNCLQVVFRLSS